MKNERFSNDFVIFFEHFLGNMRFNRTTSFIKMMIFLSVEKHFRKITKDIGF